MWSGSRQSVSPGGHLITNTFIPLEILNTRLCGDWPERQQAYMRDWLTFCGYIVGLEAERPPNERRHPKNFLPDALLPQYQNLEHLRSMLVDWNGSHLVARDSAGNISNIGAKFLYELLFDNNMQLMSASNLARHIFKRWCRMSNLEIFSPLFSANTAAVVAHSAASLAKEPFSVKARYWKIPKDVILVDRVVLVYDMVPGLWLWDVHSTILDDDKLSEGLKKVLKLFCDVNHRSQVRDLWREFMALVLKAHAAPPDTAQPITARLLRPDDNLQHMVLLGSHPQGYYNTYIRRDHLASLISNGYTWGKGRLFPERLSLNQIVPLPKGQRLTQANDFQCTTTTISNTNIKIAGNWPRIRTQNAVMENVSANEASHLPTCISHRHPDMANSE